MKELHKVYQCNLCQEPEPCEFVIPYYAEEGPHFCPYGGDFEANWVFSGICDRIRRSSVEARGVETSR